MKRILIATDGSEGANRALDYAAEIAKESGVELVVVNVMDGLSSDIFRQFTRAQHAWLNETLETMSANILKSAKEHLHAAGASSVHLVSQTGDPAQTILDVAAERNVDAIVVGKRGNGRVAGMLLGSVSQKLVSLAPCVVIVVP